MPICSAGARPRSLLAAALLLLTPAALHATEGQKADPSGTFSLIYENDLFAGTDRYYTSGIQLSWRSPTFEAPAWMAAVTQRPNLLFPADGTLRWGLSFGQNIFTPGDTTRRNPDPLDRPYAGWLYGALSLASYTPTAYGSVELQMGVVGPSALGRQAQNGVHNLRNLDRAMGWDHQLKDEFGINLIFNRQWRLNQPLGESGLAVGLVPGVTASLGNVHTYASAGMMVRLGSNLTADFGPPMNRPAISGSAFFEPEDHVSWYVFAGLEGRAIARNIFLDGNTWQDGPHVNRLPWVGDASIGAVLMFSRARLTASYTFRSREFSAQPEAAQYGSLSLSFRF